MTSFFSSILKKALDRISIIVYNRSVGALAQLGAHNTGSVGVRGSNPLCSTRKKHLLSQVLFSTKSTPYGWVKSLRQRVGGFHFTENEVFDFTRAKSRLRLREDFTFCEAKYFTFVIVQLCPPKNKTAGLARHRRNCVHNSIKNELSPTIK